MVWGAYPRVAGAQADGSQGGRAERPHLRACDEQDGVFAADRSVLSRRQTSSKEAVGLCP